MKTLTIIDLPRRNWRLLPPTRRQVFTAVAGIILSAIAFGLFNV